MALNATDTNQAMAGPANTIRAGELGRSASNIPGSRRYLSILGTRPACQDPFALPPVQRMLKYVATDDMGWGVFACEDILPGTRVVVEMPLFTTPSIDNAGVRAKPIVCPFAGYFEDPRYNRDIEFFCQNVINIGLGDERFQEMETLSCNEELARQHQTVEAVRFVLVGQYLLSLDDAAMYQLWGEPNIGYPDASINLNGMTREDYQIQSMDGLAIRYARLYTIWQENHCALAQGTDADFGIFRVASRINHSCCPNVARAWAHIGGFLPRGEVSPDAYMAQTINTTRPIRRGEQLFLAYRDYTFQRREVRDQELRALHIARCGCRLCTDPVVAALQSRAHDLWHAARHWIKPSSIKEEAKMSESSLAFPPNALEALAMAEEVVDLLTHPSWNARNIALARAYKLASIICERIASNSDGSGAPYQQAVTFWQKSQMYAGRKMQVYILMQGTDGLAVREAEKEYKELEQRRVLWMAEQRQQAMAAMGQV